MQLQRYRGGRKHIADGDLEAGLLVVPQQPGLQVRPSVKLVRSRSRQGGRSLATLTISGLVAFGETSVSILYKGHQVETLRFFKAGLIAKPVGDSGFVVQRRCPFSSCSRMSQLSDTSRFMPDYDLATRTCAPSPLRNLEPRRRAIRKRRISLAIAWTSRVGRRSTFRNTRR